MVGIKEVQKVLRKYGIKLDPLLDQNIMISDGVLEFMVKSANLTKDDIVLEIGAGTGLLTKKIAEKAGEVIAVEIDSKFEKILEEELSRFKNVRIIIGDATKIDYPEFNKIISNLPFSSCDAILKNFCKYEFELGIVTVPKSLALKLEDKSYLNKLTLLLNSTFEIDFLKEVSRDLFYPSPSTDAAILRLTKRQYTENNIFLHFTKSLLLQEDKKLKNAILEALIKSYEEVLRRKLTKREAKKLVENLGLSKNLLEEKVASIASKDLIYILDLIRGKVVES